MKIIRLWTDAHNLYVAATKNVELARLLNRVDWCGIRISKWRRITHS
jgi:hypothetical protein